MDFGVVGLEGLVDLEGGGLRRSFFKGRLRP
jgi:hypothetical protein